MGPGSSSAGGADTARSVLRTGSTGEAVAELQRRLAALGFAIPASEHADYAERTEAAIRVFQTNRGIRVDGVCGAETWGAVLDSEHRFGDRMLCVRRPMLRGDDVAELQARLNSLGFDAGKEDGILGPNTERALTEFQRNAGVAVDGICGRETIAALDRLGSRADGAVAVARERDTLRDPRALVGYRVYVTAGVGLESLARALVGGLTRGGADARLDLTSPDESALAVAANEFAADLFVAIRARSGGDGEPRDDVTCRCCFYASGRFRSEAGYAIATAVAHAVAETLDGTGAACGRAYTVLRETRMAAIVCEPVIEDRPDSFAALEARSARVADAAIAAIRDALARPSAPTGD